jgi:hypothetical protein
VDLHGDEVEEDVVTRRDLRPVRGGRRVNDVGLGGRDRVSCSVRLSHIFVRCVRGWKVGGKCGLVRPLISRTGVGLVGHRPPFDRPVCVMRDAAAPQCWARNRR